MCTFYRKRGWICKIEWRILTKSNNHCKSWQSNKQLKGRHDKVLYRLLKPACEKDWNNKTKHMATVNGMWSEINTCKGYLNKNRTSFHIHNHLRPPQKKNGKHIFCHFVKTCYFDLLYTIQSPFVLKRWIQNKLICIHKEFDLAQFGIYKFIWSFDMESSCFEVVLPTICKCACSLHKLVQLMTHHLTTPHSDIISYKWLNVKPWFN